MKDDPLYKKPGYNKSYSGTFEGTNREFLIQVLDKREIAPLVSGLGIDLNYAAFEFILKKDIPAKKRAQLSRIYNSAGGKLSDELVLHDDWKDENGKWKYPTLEDRTLTTFKEF